MAVPHTFKVTLSSIQMETLEEWLRNFNGAAESKDHEWTLQQAFEHCIHRGLAQFSTENYDQDQKHADEVLVHMRPRGDIT